MNFLARIFAYIVIGFLTSGALFGVYKTWELTVKMKAMAEFNQKQLEQVIKDAAEFKKKMDAIGVSQKEIVKELETQIKVIDSQLDEIDNFLDSDNAKKLDRSSSKILKDTVRKLAR
jgi:hypothetical protein